MAFLAGYSQGATFQAAGAGGATSLLVTGWTWEELVNALEVTHSGTGGQQAVIAGVLSGTGNVTASLDTANLPYAAAPGVKAGVKGVVKLSTGTTNAWTIPCMIEKVNHASAVGGLVTYNFDVKFDQLSGTYAYPS